MAPRRYQTVSFVNSLILRKPPLGSFCEIYVTNTEAKNEHKCKRNLIAVGSLLSPKKGSHGVYSNPRSSNPLRFFYQNELAGSEFEPRNFHSSWIFDLTEKRFARSDFEPTKFPSRWSFARTEKGLLQTEFEPLKLRFRWNFARTEKMFVQSEFESTKFNSRIFARTETDYLRSVNSNHGFMNASSLDNMKGLSNSFESWNKTSLFLLTCIFVSFGELNLQQIAYHRWNAPDTLKLRAQKIC